MKIKLSTIILALLFSIKAYSQNKNLLFGSGFINYTLLENEEGSLNFINKAGEKEWSKTCPNLILFDDKWTESSQFEDALVANENSDVAYYCHTNGMIKEIGQIDIEGTILKKKINLQELFPTLQKRDMLSTYFCFVSSNKLYIVLQKSNDKTNLEFTYHLLEIDESLNYKLVELPNSSLQVDKWKNGEISKVRYVAHQEGELIYGSWIKLESGEYRFDVTNYDLLNHSVRKEFKYNLPIVQEKKDVLIIFPSDKSYHFDSGIQVRNDWRFEKQVKTNYMYVSDIGEQFQTYYLNNELFIWGVKSESKGFSAFNTKINFQDDELLKINTIPINTIIKPGNVDKSVFEGIPKPYFDPVKKEFIYLYIQRKGFENYEYHYFKIENNAFKELIAPSNQFIPTAFIAANMEYLAHDGAYNFPELNAWENNNHNNVQLLMGKNRLLICYRPTKSETLKIINSFKELGFMFYMYDID